jgi:hypothetical protein
MKPAALLDVVIVMEMNEARFSEETVTPNVFVKAPSVHQGVADALRSAFIPERQKLPDDFMELLSRLS